MKTTVASLSALALLSGCSDEPAAPPPPEPTAQPAVQERPEPLPENALASVADLQGEYRVAGIDDEPLNTEFGIALSIVGQVLSFEPVCAGFVWTISIAPDGRLQLVRNPDFGPERQDDGTVAVCSAAVPPELTQLGDALDRISVAQRTPEGGLLLSGNGRSVTLFSQ